MSDHRIRVTLKGLIRGFEAEIEIEPDPRKLAASVAYLEKQGFEPAAQSQQWTMTYDGKPICPVHGVAMDSHEKQGDTWYSHAVGKDSRGDTIYCRGYAHPSSPGFELQSREPGEDDDLDDDDCRDRWNDDEPRPVNGHAAKQLPYNGKTNGHSNGHSNGTAAPWARTVPTKSRFGRGI